MPIQLWYILNMHINIPFQQQEQIKEKPKTKQQENKPSHKAQGEINQNKDNQTSEPLKIKSQVINST